MLAPGILRLRPDNLVERPWGGTGLFAFKGLGAPPPDKRYGESFEVAADPADPDATKHPSAVLTSDGGEHWLVDLLRANPESILGKQHALSLGPRIPLLPKFLDVQGMLSVQTHPPGNPEVYVILQAAPGATIRVGFRRDVDRARFREQMLAGIRAQEELLDRVGDVARLEARLGPWLATRSESAAAVAREVAPGIVASVESLLLELARTYRHALDALNAIPVAAGQIVFNSTPDGRSADVHALGNPEGRAILMFEIRRTGPTLRLWDHARVPPRRLQVAEALAALPAEGHRDPARFMVTPRPIAPGVMQSIDCEAFAAMHLRPSLGSRTSRPAADGVRTLHVLSGAVLVEPGAALLRRGESAVVPAALGAYAVAATEDHAEVVEVSLPRHAV